MRFPGFIGPSYTSQSVNVDAQRCVNWFPEKNDLGTGKEGEVMSLVPTPGLTLLCTLPESPVRGLWRASTGTLFAVAGSKAYSIDSSFTATEIGSLNTSTGPVSICDNGLHVVFVDGTDGFAYTISGSIFAEITDPDFLGADQVTYLDGYFIFNSPDSEIFYITDLKSITFDALDFANSEGRPDYIVGLISSNQLLLVFGTQSLEVYYNSGDAAFPFTRQQGAVVDIGCIAPFSIVRMLDTVYWVGGDETGSGIVYRTQGTNPQRISTPSIEAVIRSLAPEDLSAATAYTYQQGGHLFYCLNLPTTESTWVFDASTGLWHERTYLNLWSLERHRAECHAVAYGKNVVGDYQTGKLYAFDPDSLTDNGISIKRIRAAPHLSSGGTLACHSEIQIDMEAGVGLSSGQGSDPKVMIRWSDDGGHTWSNEHQMDLGMIGQYRARAIKRRLGMSRDRIYEISISDPVKAVLIGAWLRVEPGAA